jgi:hypothetical protein
MTEESNPGMTSRDREFLGIYQQNLTEVTVTLGDDEKKSLKATAKEWNECGPPTEVKRR